MNFCLIFYTTSVGTSELGYPSCRVKARVVVSNYALKSWAAGPLGSGSISPDQRHRTRFPLGAGPVSPRVPGKEALRAKRPGAPDPPRGPGPPHTIRTPQRGGNRHPTRGGPEPPRVTQVAARARVAATLPREGSPTYRIQRGKRRCALL